MDIAASNIESTRLTRGYIICIVATVLWSSTAIFIRYLTETYRIPPLVLAFWRDLFLVGFLVLLFAIIRPQFLHIERKHLKFLFLYGVVISLFNSLWTISVALNGAAVSTVLAYSSAAFTALLGWKLFSESLDLYKVAAVLLSLSGCVFVSGAYSTSAWQVNSVGVVTGLISGIAFAGFSLMGKAASQRAIQPWSTLLFSFMFAVPFLLSYNILAGWLPEGIASTNLFWLGAEPVGWMILLLLAIGPTIGGYGLYTLSLTYLPASVANIIATLEPVMTAILAFILLGESFTIPQWTGSGLILIGVFLLRFSDGFQRG